MNVKTNAMNPEQLLQQLIDGQVTPKEFKRLATAPQFIMVFYTDPSRENAGQMDPEDTAVLFIDGERREMKWREFEAFRAAWPGAEYMPPAFFEPERE